MRYVWYYPYPMFSLGFVEENGAITGVFFDKGARGGLIPQEETPLIKRASTQMAEYCAGERRAFDFPIAPKGTVFQHKVWDAAAAIPYGETRSYKEIALITGNHNAARAVGMANNHNPIAIVIPCHRVVGSSGSLVGYGGGLDVKKYLLELEKSSLSGRLGAACK